VAGPVGVCSEVESQMAQNVQPRSPGPTLPNDSTEMPQEIVDGAEAGKEIAGAVASTFNMGPKDMPTEPGPPTVP
jgi:hypothetical protein